MRPSFKSVVCFLGCCLIPSCSSSQEKVTYHVGMGSALLWYDNGARHLPGSPSIALPVGANVAIRQTMRYDVEVAPVFTGEGVSNIVLLHGLLIPVGGNYILDGRSAFELMGRKAYGFNLGFSKFIPFSVEKTRATNFFLVVTAFLPFRFGRNVTKSEQVVPTIGFQLGFTF